jgi:hypothetical protein
MRRSFSRFLPLLVSGLGYYAELSLGATPIQLGCRRRGGTWMWFQRMLEDEQGRVDATPSRVRFEDGHC